MQVHNDSNQKFYGISLKFNVLEAENNLRNKKYINLACKKVSKQIGISESILQRLTDNADIERFKLLEKMANKFKIRTAHKQNENSIHLINIYSMLEKPFPEHFNIVSRSHDSFESLEEIFSLARDEQSLGFVENLQRDVLKESNNSSMVIIDLLNSPNRDKYINNLKSYTSYLKLHSEDKNVIDKLDKLIISGKYSRLKSDAKLAIKNLMKKKFIRTMFYDKENALSETYTKERGNFLLDIVKSFIPVKKTTSDTTKNTLIDMYNSVNAKNNKIRLSILERFKYGPKKNKAEELQEMKILFDKIDNNKDVQKFVQKVISRDLRVNSIGELNEILDTAPIKKANVFFNNAKRIIEQTSGEERQTALIRELENPFYIPKNKQKDKRLIRICAYAKEESFFSKIQKNIENKINKFIYYHNLY